MFENFPNIFTWKNDAIENPKIYINLRKIILRQKIMTLF